jgi:hypothetical protein
VTSPRYGEPARFRQRPDGLWHPMHHGWHGRVQSIALGYGPVRLAILDLLRPCIQVIERAVVYVVNIDGYDLALAAEDDVFNQPLQSREQIDPQDPRIRRLVITVRVGPLSQGHPAQPELAPAPTLSTQGTWAPRQSFATHRPGRHRSPEAIPQPVLPVLGLVVWCPPLTSGSCRPEDTSVV